MSSLNLKLPFDFRISECLNERQKLIKKCKYYSLLIFHFMYIIHSCVIYRKLGSLKSNDLPLYYFGIFHYYGGLSQLYYAIIVICSSYTIQYLILINRKLDSRQKWRQLIEALNSESPSLNSFGLTDEVLRDAYLDRILFVTRLTKIGFYLHSIMFSSVTLFLTFISMSFIDFIIYGIPALFMLMIYIVAWLLCAYFGFLHFFIVCYFCQVKLKIFNTKLNMVKLSKRFVRQWQIIRIVKELDHIYAEINSFNEFWKSYIFSIYYTFIPTLLIFIESIFFEQQNNGMIYVVIFMSLVLSSMIIGFNLITASINSQTIITFKILQKLYLNNNSLIRSKGKLKVI